MGGEIESEGQDRPGDFHPLRDPDRPLTRVHQEITENTPKGSGISKKEK